MQDAKYKILLTGGGTAGHIFPILAVYDELNRMSFEYKFDFLFMTDSKQNFSKIVLGNRPINYKKIYSGKLRRYWSLQNLVDPFKIIVGIIQSFCIISFFKPDVVFAKGGYVTFPVVFAANVLKIPIVIHESDIVMGLANRIEAKMAKKICVGFPTKFYSNIFTTNMVYTGNPVRKEFIDIAKKNSDLGERQTLLITGGSQGSRIINQAIASIMPKLVQKYHVIHICGNNDYDWLSKSKWPNYDLYSFTDKMPDLMNGADLIISRASANTMFEIATLKKPSILIPLANAANGHQLANAKVFEQSNASVLISENKLTPSSLYDIINNLMSDKKILKDMGDNANKLVNNDSAKLIANEIIKALNGVNND